MQTDRQDKCALGWDHQEKVQLHESQKGTAALSSLLFFLPPLPVTSCCPGEPPAPGCSGTASQELTGGSFPVSGFLLSLVELVAAEQLWHSWHPAPQSPGSGLNSHCMSLQVAWIVFLFQLSCANHRLGIPLGFSQIIFSLLDSVVYIPVFMQGQSKIPCSLSSWPVGYLLL